MGKYDWAAWLGLAAILGVVEVTTLDLTFLMLAAGALAGTGAALADWNIAGSHIAAQAVVAIVTAVAMLAVVRPVALRHIRVPAVSRTGVAALVGAPAVTVERVDGRSGFVKLKGEVWSARTYDPSHVIEAGRNVEIVQIDGATAVVYESEL